MKEVFNDSEESIESELKFVFKFIFSSIVAVFCLIPCIFIPSLREKVKRPFIDLVRFLSSAKITFVLIVINVLVFFLVEPFLIKFNMLSPIANLSLKITGVRFIDILLNIFATGFLHADLGHIGGNMLALLVFGRIIEKYLPERYLIIYFGAHFLGAIAQFLLAGPGIGASAAISGLIFAAILIRPLYLSFAAIIPLPVFILGWLGVYGDFASFIVKNNDNIAHLAHIGGYFAGFIVALFFVSFDKKEEIKKGIVINIVGLTLLLLAWFFILKK